MARCRELKTRERSGGMEAQSPLALMFATIPADLHLPMWSSPAPAPVLKVVPCPGPFTLQACFLQIMSQFVVSRVDGNLTIFFEKTQDSRPLGILIQVT